MVNHRYPLEAAFGRIFPPFEQAKIGILLGSLSSAVIGLTWLYWAGSGAKKSPP